MQLHLALILTAACLPVIAKRSKDSKNTKVPRYPTSFPVHFKCLTSTGGYGHNLYNMQLEILLAHLPLLLLPF